MGIVYPNQPWFVGWLARLLLYTPTNPGSLGGQQGSYCIPQPTLFIGWSWYLLYTPTNPGSLGGQPGSYCIPQPTLVCWVVNQAPIVYPNRPWFVGWSARLLLYTPTDSGLLGGQPGSYCIPQPTLVRWVVS